MDGWMMKSCVTHGREWHHTKLIKQLQSNHHTCINYHIIPPFYFLFFEYMRLCVV